MRQIGRRTLLKSLSAGAGGLAFAPLLNKLAAQEAGTDKTSKRVVFVLFGNGFHEPQLNAVESAERYWKTSSLCIEGEKI